jgi:hypothetical protein
MTTPQRFEIKQERQPKRCEVCHQTDLFDPKTGVCQRCQGTLPARLVIVSPPRLSPLPPLPAALARLEYAPLAPGQASQLTYRDVIEVWTAAVRLYFQHFRVFCGVSALVEIPRFLAFFVIGQVFHPHHGPFALMYVFCALLMCLVPVPEIARGAIVWAVHDSLPDQSPQFRTTLQKATAKGWGSVWIVWKSNFTNLFVLFGISIIGGAASGIYHPILRSPSVTVFLMVLTILIGASVSLTLFQGLHLPIAFLEGTSLQVTSQRSQWFTVTNLIRLLPIEFFRRSGLLLMGLAFFLLRFSGWPALSEVDEFLPIIGGCVILPPVIWMNIACFFPLLFGGLLILKLVLSPVLTIAQTLFYMLLRARAEAPRGMAQPLSDTILS